MKTPSHQEPDVWIPAFFQSSPLFTPICLAAENFQFNAKWPSLNDYNQAVKNSKQEIATASNKTVSFVPPTKLPDNFSNLYEPRIYQLGEVQTRPANWHDFFNMLVWLTFPKAKARLNNQQYLLQQQRLNKKQRTPAENYLTLFDENGIVVLSANAELTTLLQNFQWLELFWRRREEVIQNMRFFVFGHSLYEKALNPYIGMTANALIFAVSPAVLQQSLTEQNREVDLLLTDYLSQQANLADSQAFAPLPLLGIPGWWQDNNDSGFYKNTAYFRPGRKSQ